MKKQQELAGLIRRSECLKTGGKEPRGPVRTTVVLGLKWKPGFLCRWARRGGGVHPSDRSVGSRQRGGQAEDNVYVAAWTLRANGYQTGIAMH